MTRTASSTAPARLAAAAVLVLAGAFPARGEEAARPAKKPYEHYKLIETRNIFAPPGAAGARPAEGGAAAAAGGSSRLPVLTGIVYDARRDLYKGLIETPGQSEPLYVAAGDTTQLGRVTSVSLDRLVIEGEKEPIEVPLGGTLSVSGAPSGASPSAAPIDNTKAQEVLEKMKARYGKRGDEAAEEPKGGEAQPVVEEKHRSILDMLKLKRRRPGTQPEKQDK
jgi:hypothetical protein